MSLTETIFDSVPDPVPGTPGILEVRSDSRPEKNYQIPNDDPGFLGSVPNPSWQGIRRVGLRAEIDTSPPFGSVKEAVTRFGGSGPWIPNYNGNEEFDIKRVEEQAAELEKDLIVKELQTLDILEELNTNKRIVEELKRHLQQEASKCSTPIPDSHLDMSTPPHVKEMNNEASSSPEMIMMELKQAKMNLGKTINDLGGIQTSVESLNKRMKKEKSLIERTCERLTSKFVGPAVGQSLEEQLKHARIKSHVPKHGRIDITTAEMRWVAAKKMEEAARASEALAMAELKALSGSGSSSGFFLPEPLLSPRHQNIRKLEGLPRNKFVHGIHQLGEANISKLAMFRKLEEATEEVLQRKHALDEALSRVEIVNQKQIAVEEALRKWIPRSMYNPGKLFDFDSSYVHPHHSPLNFVDKPSIVSDEPKPILRPTVSMRDILRRKPVLTEDFVGRDRNDGQKVALSQMLNDLKGDLTFHTKSDQKEEKNDHPKQMFTQRRKFGFIHISLPTKQSKKKVQDQYKSRFGMMSE
ncbi:hypothetical protein ACFE04_017805 [Oxalis oulophora]